MSAPRPLDTDEQWGALCIIGYLEGMMTESPREQFSKTEILILLNLIKNDPELFAPETLEAYEATCAEVEAQ